MTKTRAKQKNTKKRTAKYKIQLIKIRDWLGFFFTVAGFFLSLYGTVHIDIQAQGNIVINVYNSSFGAEKTKWNLEDFLLNLESDIGNMEKDNTDKQKHPIEWVYINFSEHPQDTQKRKKCSMSHKNEP